MRNVVKSIRSKLYMNATKTIMPLKANLKKQVDKRKLTNITALRIIYYRILLGFSSFFIFKEISKIINLPPPFLAFASEIINSIVLRFSLNLLIILTVFYRFVLTTIAYISNIQEMLMVKAYVSAKQMNKKIDMCWGNKVKTRKCKFNEINH